MGPAPRVVGASNLEAPVGWIQFDLEGLSRKCVLKCGYFLSNSLSRTNQNVSGFRHTVSANYPLIVGPRRLVSTNRR